MATYSGEWENHEDLQGQSGCDVTPDELVFASYNAADYEGWSQIVFVRDGKWFENHDSHCSCNGLDVWEPEETSPEAILMRPDAADGLHEAVRARIAA